MRIPPQIEFGPGKPDRDVIQKAWLLLSKAFNGLISFGDGVKSDNMEGSWGSMTTPVTPGTAFFLPHGLNRTPVGFIVMFKDAPCDVYSVTNTNKDWTFKATAGGVAIKIFMFLLLLCFATRSSAQSVVFHDIAVYNASGTVKVIPSATITVCPSTASLTQSPCSPASVAIFQDSSLTQALSNPFNADVNGNFSFWVLTGSYVVSITGASVNGFTYAITPGGGVGALPGALYRIQPVLATALVPSDFADPSASGWGTGAAISNVSGTDTAFTFTVTAGTTPTANPTLKLNFHDGPWLTVTMVDPEFVGGTGSASDTSWATDLSSVTLTYLGLPVNTKTYTFSVIVAGNSNVTATPPAPINPVVINPGALQNIVNYPLGVTQLDLNNNNTPGNPITGRLRLYSKADNKLYYRTSLGAENLLATASGSAGTVTSVGLTLPADLFNLSGSPIVTSGTFVATKATVSAGTVMGGPPSGPAGQWGAINLTQAYLPFTYQGNTSALFTCTGVFTVGHFVTVDASGNCIDGGAAPVTTTQEQWTSNVTSNTCPTSGSSFDTCTYTLTWPTAWANTSYLVTCQGITPFDADNAEPGRLIPNGVSGKTTTTVTFKISSAGASHVSYAGGVNCHGKL